MELSAMFISCLQKWILIAPPSAHILVNLNYSALRLTLYFLLSLEVRVNSSIFYLQL